MSTTCAPTDLIERDMSKWRYKLERKLERKLAEAGRGPVPLPVPQRVDSAEAGSGPVPLPEPQRVDSAEARASNAPAARKDVVEAHKYFDRVKQAFMGERHKFSEFRTLLTTYATKVEKEPDILPVMVSNVKKLFRGHEELIEGFNMFLPEGLQMTQPPTKNDEPGAKSSQPPEPQPEEEPIVQSQREDPSQDGIVAWCDKAGDALPEDDFRAIRDILLSFSERNDGSSQSVKKLIAEVEEHLKGHDDLVEEFIALVEPSN